jgi:hypothetical protein
MKNDTHNERGISNAVESRVTFDGVYARRRVSASGRVEEVIWGAAAPQMLTAALKSLVRYIIGPMLATVLALGGWRYVDMLFPSARPWPFTGVQAAPGIEGAPTPKIKPPMPYRSRKRDYRPPLAAPAPTARGKTDYRCGNPPRNE